MADSVLIKAWKRFSEANRRFAQFGQTDDESTWNGATGCTHSVLQRLIKAWTGKTLSHDEISKIAGYPWPTQNPNRRGMYPSEMQRVIDHFGIPMRYKAGASWDDIVDGLRRGPVVTGILYGYWPEMKGARYAGKVADGRPGGYAFINGKTQLAGAETIFHAVLFFGRKRVRGIWRILGNEPNHGSAARPERPVWDAVRSSHARRAFDMYGYTGRTHFAWLPTAYFKPKGY
jgi:hypothetical protein